MRRGSLFPLGLALLSACGAPPRDRAPEPARPPSATPPRAPASLEATTPRAPTTAASTSEPPKVPASTWRTAARPQGPLYVVAEGHCPAMTVSAIEGAVLVGYRHGIARADDRGIVDDPAVNERKKLVELGKVERFVGRWPDRAYVLYDNDGRCDHRVRAGRWSGSEWQLAFDKVHPSATLDPATFIRYGAGAMAVGLCGGCGGAPEGCRDAIVTDGLAPAPPITADGLEAVQMAAASTGELFVLGRACNKDRAQCGLVLRRWAPGGKVATDYLGSDSYATLNVVSGAEVYVSGASAYWTFDGAKLSRSSFPPGFRSPYISRAEGHGVLWFSDREESSRRVVRRDKEGAVEDMTSKVAPEAPRRKLSDLPAPVFSDTGARFTAIEASATSPDGGEWLVATYVEKRAGWYEFEMRRALLHDKPPAEVSRCASRSTWGYGEIDVPKPFTSWPPPASEGCAHPHAVVMDLSATTPASWDFPKLRALFRGRPELGVTEILEIVVGGRRHVAVRTATPELARRAAEAAARNIPMTKPETACGEPEIVRRVPVQ